MVKINIACVAKEKLGSVYMLSKRMKIPQQTLYSWANGRTQPNYENIDRLCRILDCTLGELFEADRPH